jgi:hypothetical protein
MTTKGRIVAGPRAWAAPVALALVTLVAGACIAPPGASGLEFESLGAAYTDNNGAPARQAGSHPDVKIDFTLVRQNPSDPDSAPVELARRIKVDLPPGLIGNPTGIETCSFAGLKAGVNGGQAICPVESQVGVATIPGFGSVPIYNVEVPKGMAGLFAFNFLGSVVRLSPTVRPGDYGVTIDSGLISQGSILSGAEVDLWGVPADPVHDPMRWAPNAAGTSMVPGAPSPAPRRPFITLPTSCPDTAAVTTAWLEGWESIGLFSSRSFSSDLDGEPFTFSGCDQLAFEPTVRARPTTNVADSPTGLDISIAIPQNGDPDGFAASHLKDARLILPPGMTVNPAAADGLGACTTVQIGLTTPVGRPDAVFDGAGVRCPNSSKLGTARIETPLLDHPLVGSIFLASQNENPFGSLLAVYVVVEDPQTGTVIKLAGHPETDPETGRLAINFDRNPQLPFEELQINLFAGPRAALKTPLACGAFTTTTTMTPWSSPQGADAEPSDSFPIIRGANGSTCVDVDDRAPNRPAFSAGSVDPAAGAYSPFVLKISREDGSQPLSAFDAALPRGLLGRLAGIPYCSDFALAAVALRSGKAERALPSCSSASRVGALTLDAGAGSTPLQVAGTAYLAGPYKGAPLSLAIVTPALAGPFDLGTVVVRTALRIDPETTQIHAVSDPFPTILQGIPLDIRRITLNLDRPSFTLNPTSCEPTSVPGSATSVFGHVALLDDRFQVGGCRGLGFKPRLSLRFVGPTHRSAHPKLVAKLTARPGDANIRGARMLLPPTQFLENSHIEAICTRAQYAARACPVESVYGYAKAWSPLLDRPLQGPVYLRSSDRDLPDLAASLDGQMHVDLAARIDSKDARIRGTFETVPDAPLRKLVLTMLGGKKGLLVNNTELCRATPRAAVRFEGQNGKTYRVNPVVKADCDSFRSGGAPHPARP